MYSPKKSNKQQTNPNSKPERSPSPSSRLSPNSKRSNLKPKTLSDLKPIKPGEKSVRSPTEKHERSFSGLYSKFSPQKVYSQAQEIGYSAQQIKDAVNYIFLKYDKNKDGFLDKNEVRALIQRSLVHIGSPHKPTQLEVIEFIYSMDKNSDGKLSRGQLQNAFKRANRIEY